MKLNFLISNKTGYIKDRRDLLKEKKKEWNTKTISDWSDSLSRVVLIEHAWFTRLVEQTTHSENNVFFLSETTPIMIAEEWLMSDLKNENEFESSV